jgi:hypothetical protein
MSITKKIVAIVTAVTCAAWMMGPSTAQAVTAAELQAQIDALLAQLTTLQNELAAMGGGTVAITGCTITSFTRDLSQGMNGEDVKCLQIILNSSADTQVAATSYGSPGNETIYFGSLTLAAVKKFQTKYGLDASGFVGAATRAELNAILMGEEEEEEEEGVEGLEGGAGAVDQYDLVSGLQNEEVGEDREDVDVAGLEMEVSDTSDLEFTAVTLDFDQNSANNDDFDEYASEVSLWLDGDEVARVDATKFDEDTAWRRTVTLDEGAIVRAGDTCELILAISGASNIDSDDVGETWDVDFDLVRYVDATGASTSEDPGTDVRTFSFESFATSSDIELKVALNDDEEDVNEAHVIDIDDADDTDNVEFLAFTIEIEGDSDITVDEIPVVINTVEAADTDFNDPDDVISSASLWMDGDEVATENLSTADNDDDTETVTFEDLDLELEADETYEFMVKLDLVSTDDDLDNGDTIEVEIDADTVDDIDAEDESGEDLGAGDLTGTADADAHAVYDAGIYLEFVSASATRSSVADADGEIDTGEFKIRFEATAFDDDMQIDRTCVEDGGQAGDGEGTSFVFVTSADDTEGWTIASILSRITGDTGEDDVDIFEIDEGDTDTFELTVSATPDEDSFTQLTLEAVNWATSDTDNDASDQFYTFSLDEFKTDSIFLNVF